MTVEIDKYNSHSVGEHEWGAVWADGRDPDAGGASHHYEVRGPDGEVYVSVRFQHGPRALDSSAQGALDEHLFMVSMDRLRAFQEGPFAHPSNERALAYVEAASSALRERAAERRARGVLGKNEK
jgi:hypothetical protein|tara:strand:+ start:250 stop:624 length:375 start_codon:yes stop_codon:yes gene_type:complete